MVRSGEDTQNNVELESRTSDGTKDESCKKVDSIVNKWHSNCKIFWKLHAIPIATINNTKSNQRKILGDKEKVETEGIVLPEYKETKKEKNKALMLKIQTGGQITSMLSLLNLLKRKLQSCS